VDNPVGPNQRQKDSSIKENLIAGRAEWWFLVRVFWLVEQPRHKEDHTEPKPPNTLAMARELLGNQSCDFELTADAFEKFYSDSLKVYVMSLNKPTTIEVEHAFDDWMAKEYPSEQWNPTNTKKTIGCYLEYCPGRTLPKFGTRKRGGVNCYMHEGEIVVRKTTTLFDGPAPAVASASSVAELEPSV